MKTQIFASIAALPFALAGVLSGAGAANAAGFGEFQIGGGFLLPGGMSTVTLSDEGLDFNPEPITPIGITSATGIFEGFDTASIEDFTAQDFTTLLSPVQVEGGNSFIDFGNSDLGWGGLSTLANASIQDGVDTFELYQASYRLSESNPQYGLVSINVDLFGDFNIGGQTYKGAGNLTFQKVGTTVAEVEALLASGDLIEGMTFSGAAFTTSVPEPATVFGLGAVAVGLVASRRSPKNS
ncbi:PEP-CTERM sorting domain-containing protein [Lyngbya sp. CCY1209]|jgi:hypothetical protein|uniref:PEP-CTERM sorting domain-containing protein n=1 Tax=Lyngbya sp. CCY1209 TaxID=2886103 RepID=UPI002D20EAA7|nr:PEP-CTERM sorting domain-containing protein [Lyngbya sp. CCY1209]MEB3882625.1 PEP-CTERM sorting domain-containing protein [Lyngbya sp. CCY1209]